MEVSETGASTACKPPQSVTWYTKGVGGDHFTTPIFFINLELKFDQTPKVYRMILKISPEDPIFRKYIDADVLFHNENLMHKKVIPLFEEFLKKRQTVSLGQILPKCYCDVYATNKTGSIHIQ
jgi:hypothetical protein